MVFCNAVGSGDITILKWIYEKGGRFSSDCYHKAAQMKRFDLMKWLYEHKCQWDGKVFYYTIRYYQENCVNFQILEWLLENNCPMSSDCFWAAANMNRLDILKWLKLRGCPSDESAFICAAEKENFEMFKWLYENGYKINKNNSLPNRKILNTLLKFIKAINPPKSYDTNNRIGFTLGYERTNANKATIVY
jgi:phage antirepressor YoqD-like protein